MRKLFITFVSIFILIQAYADNYNIEKIEFPVNDSIKLKGMLYLPKNTPVKKIIVSITGNLTFDNQSDSALYNYKLMEKLANNGVGWLFCASNLYKGFRILTIYTYANDADSAVSYLKHRQDTRNCRIGIMGQSEAGMASTVSTYRNPNIDFMISVTSFMMKGPDFMLENIFSPSNIKTHGSKGESIFDNFKTILKDTFTYNNTKFLKSDETFMKCLKSSLDTMNKTVFAMEPIANIHFSDKKEDILKYFDSTLNATKMFQKLWTINDTMPRNNLTDNDLNYLNFVKYLSYHLYNPHDIAFIQWNPELYFPKITVPILILLGEKDNLIPFEKNLKGINDIVERYNKKNITVKVFNGHGHALVVDNQNSTEDQQAAINTPSTPDTTINWMADWIRGLD